ncbi:uncharacterized protein BDW70DRAFT_61637 [Aspergillus foveolatus]|uniref:uncharacterized protein n=1 Tax=Aspergillus foveolatus TaxID=210207 RepID=UPI003CCE3CD5
MGGGLTRNKLEVCTPSTLDLFGLCHVAGGNISSVTFWTSFGEHVHVSTGKPDSRKQALAFVHTATIGGELRDFGVWCIWYSLVFVFDCIRLLLATCLFMTLSFVPCVISFCARRTLSFFRVNT